MFVVNSVCSLTNSVKSIIKMCPICDVLFRLSRCVGRLDLSIEMFVLVPDLTLPAQREMAQTSSLALSLNTNINIKPMDR